MSDHQYIQPPPDYKAQHDGSEHLAINNTCFRRFWTLLALHTTAKLYSLRDKDNHNGPYIIPISKTKIVKTGRRIHLTEGATMKYVADHTTGIPVPKVYCSFLHRKRAYIVMERIQGGEELPRAWGAMSQEARDAVLLQLRRMIGELRGLTAPSSSSPGVTGVQSCVGGSLFDDRLSGRGNPRWGPFKTIHDFHVWLRRDYSPEDLRQVRQGTHLTDQEASDIEDMMSRQDREGQWASPVFTHCDLNPTNILVRDGKVVGIIDWEFAGWYPPYWEYTSAWFGSILRPWWQAQLDHFLDRPCHEDFKMEQVRNTWWGEW